MGILKRAAILENSLFLNMWNRVVPLPCNSTSRCTHTQENWNHTSTEKLPNLYSQKCYQNCQQVDVSQMCINWQVDKENVTSTEYYDKENTHSMGEPLKKHAERKKPDIKSPLLFSLHEMSQIGKFIATQLYMFIPYLPPCWNMVHRRSHVRRLWLLVKTLQELVTPVSSKHGVVLGMCPCSTCSE